MALWHMVEHPVLGSTNKLNRGSAPLKKDLNIFWTALSLGKILKPIILVSIKTDIQNRKEDMKNMY